MQRRELLRLLASAGATPLLAPLLARASEDRQLAGRIRSLQRPLEAGLRHAARRPAARARRRCAGAFPTRWPARSTASARPAMTWAASATTTGSTATAWCSTGHRGPAGAPPGPLCRHAQARRRSARRPPADRGLRHRPAGRRAAHLGRQHQRRQHQRAAAAGRGARAVGRRLGHAHRRAHARHAGPEDLAPRPRGHALLGPSQGGPGRHGLELRRRRRPGPAGALRDRARRPAAPRGRGAGGRPADGPRLRRDRAAPGLPDAAAGLRRRSASSAGTSFLDAHVWRPELGMRALVVDKKDWDKRQLLTLPAGFLFHVGNAWEEATPRGARIHIDYVRSEDASSVFTTNRELMRGRRVTSPEPHLTVATLDLGTGRATQHALDVAAEFPRIDPRRVGLRHRSVVHATQLHEASARASARSRAPMSKPAARSASSTGRRRWWRSMCSCPTAAAGLDPGHRARPGAEEDAAVVLRGRRPGGGPVAQATLPYALPLGLTGPSCRPELARPPPLAEPPLQEGDEARHLARHQLGRGKHGVDLLLGSAWSASTSTTWPGASESLAT